MAAPAIRFSLDDVGQVIHLITDICKALRESGGAEDEFKLLLIELHSLELLLQGLLDGFWDYGVDAGHLNAVKELALVCKVNLKDFLRKIDNFKKLCCSGVSGVKAKVKVGAAKLRWAFQMKNEVERFRTKIMANLVSINGLLQLIMM